MMKPTEIMIMTTIMLLCIIVIQLIVSMFTTEMFSELYAIAFCDTGGINVNGQCPETVICNVNGERSVRKSCAGDRDTTIVPCGALTLPTKLELAGCYNKDGRHCKHTDWYFERVNGDFSQRKPSFIYFKLTCSNPESCGPATQYTINNVRITFNKIMFYVRSCVFDELEERKPSKNSTTLQKPAKDSIDMFVENTITTPASLVQITNPRLTWFNNGNLDYALDIYKPGTGTPFVLGDTIGFEKTFLHRYLIAVEDGIYKMKYAFYDTASSVNHKWCPEHDLIFRN
jgi:hypothetical protein